MPQTFPGPGHRYDLLVVGAGLAGSELAILAARSGLDVLLLTTSLDTVYMLASDAALLEPQPGTLMRELAGPLQGSDGRVGSWALHRAAKQALERTPGLHLLQSNATALTAQEGTVTGVETWEGVQRRAARTALCAGSFLAARLTVGSLTEAAGRLSEMAYDELYDDLAARGFAFEDASFAADEAQGSLAYTVRCRVFAPVERQGFRLPRLKRLYAAGACLEPALGYEAAAAQGAALARALLDEVREEPAS